MNKTSIPNAVSYFIGWQPIKQEGIALYRVFDTAEGSALIVQVDDAHEPCWAVRLGLSLRMEVSCYHCIIMPVTSFCKFETMSYNKLQESPFESRARSKWSIFLSNSNSMWDVKLQFADTKAEDGWIVNSGWDYFCKLKVTSKLLQGTWWLMLYCEGNL